MQLGLQADYTPRPAKPPCSVLTAPFAAAEKEAKSHITHHASPLHKCGLPALKSTALGFAAGGSYLDDFPIKHEVPRGIDVLMINSFSTTLQFFSPLVLVAADEHGG